MWILAYEFCWPQAHVGRIWVLDRV